MKRRELLFGRACVGGEPHEQGPPEEGPPQEGPPQKGPPHELGAPHEEAVAPPLAHRIPGGEVPAPPRCTRTA